MAMVMITKIAAQAPVSLESSIEERAFENMLKDMEQSTFIRNFDQQPEAARSAFALGYVAGDLVNLITVIRTNGQLSPSHGKTKLDIISAYPSIYKTLHSP